MLVREWDAQWGHGARLVPYLPDSQRGKHTPLLLADLSGRRREGGLSNGVHRRLWLGVPSPEEAGSAPGWAAGVVREGKGEKPPPPEARGCILTAGREGTMATLATSHTFLTRVVLLARAHLWYSLFLGS